MKYETEAISRELDVAKYVEEYVNVEQFLEYCKACENYGNKWSCPPFDFDVLGYWNQFQRLYLLGKKITFDGQEQEAGPMEEMEAQMYEILSTEKQKLTEELYQMEKQFDGSVSLSAGSCSLCGDRLIDSKNCTRSTNPNCRAKNSCLHYDKMRYSIEALGGDVGRTCSRLLGIELEWVEENKLPSYFTLVCGLLKK